MGRGKFPWVEALAIVLLVGLFFLRDRGPQPTVSNASFRASGPSSARIDDAAAPDLRASLPPIDSPLGQILSLPGKGDGKPWSSLLSKFPALADLFPSLLSASHDRFRTAEGPANAVPVLALRFPERYSDGALIQAGSMRLRQTLLDAAPSVGTEEKGVAFYRDARPGVHSVILSTSSAMEEFLHRTAGSESEFRFQMTLESPGHRFRTSDGLEVVDGQETPVLKMKPILYWKKGEMPEQGHAAETSLRQESERRVTVEVSIPREDAQEELLLDPGWDTTVGPGAGRIGHTATLLPDGKVLVAGGFYPNWIRGEVETFDPATGRWSRQSGRMKRARAFHTATLLPTGMVLVAGGFGPRFDEKGDFAGYGVLRHCEIFHVASGSWFEVDPMEVARMSHTATLLPEVRVERFLSHEVEYPNDQVLVAGGITQGAPWPLPDVTERFDIHAFTWTRAAPLSRPRVYHTATLLPDGSVLWTSSARTSYLFDPANSAWTSLPTYPARRTEGQSSLLLANGKVLVTAGNSSQCDLYDPATATWSLGAPLPRRVRFSTNVLLGDGNVLVIGVPPSSSRSPYRCFVSDPEVTTWRETAPPPFQRLFGVTANLLSNGLVLATDIDGAWAVYDPRAGSWTQPGSTPGGVRMGSGTFSLFLQDTRVLFLSPSGRDAHLYDPAAGWSAGTSLSLPRSALTVSPLPNGKALAAGGETFSTGAIFDRVDLYDPATEAWQTTTPLPLRFGSGTGILLATGQVLLFDGITDGWRGQPEAARQTLLFDDTGAPSGSGPILRKVNLQDAFPLEVTGGSGLLLSGERFRGTSEGGGGSTSGSAGNHPIVRLVAFPRTGGHGAKQHWRQWTLSLDLWTDRTIYAALPPGEETPIGFYMIFIITNGVIGEGRVLRITPP